MQVFITGATGLIGSAVVAELLAHGHTVSGLARSDGSARALEEAGAFAVRGALGDLDVLAGAARHADGVVHLAFGHDFSSLESMLASVAEESAAVRAIGNALVGSDKPFVVCSGTPALPGRASVETDEFVIEGPLAGRGDSVRAVFALAERGVRAAAVRLPRTVHRDGAGGFAGLLTEIARSSGVAGFPGDGEQRWPAVHALDAAALFRLVLEQAPPGSVWHAVDDEGDRVADIAAVIGRRLGLPVRPLPEEAFGPLGAVFAEDQPASSEHTRAALGWAPTRPGLLADLEVLQP